MIENLDPVLLARIQFAFTISFHILFPAFTIGLASWLAVLEWRWLSTGESSYAQTYRMWVKIFAVTFGMGVVSGVVMSFQFGTNWSAFSDKAGNVLGPLLGYEVLTAFFLEASFLGVMLFGWNRVSPRMHFASTIIVAIAGPSFPHSGSCLPTAGCKRPRDIESEKRACSIPQTGWKLSSILRSPTALSTWSPQPT